MYYVKMCLIYSLKNLRLKKKKKKKEQGGARDDFFPIMGAKLGTRFLSLGVFGIVDLRRKDQERNEKISKLISSIKMKMF